MNCKLCNSPTESLLCNSCMRCEEKRVSFQNKRKHSKHTLYINDWIQVLDYYGYSCKGCKARHCLLTLDHVLSLSKGGLNTKENIQPLCSSCHEIKSMVETKLTGNKKKRQEALELKTEYPEIFESL